MSDQSINAYPLHWPLGWPRSPSIRESQFKTDFARARDNVLKQLELMGISSWNVIISTNVEVRQDGLPYAGRRDPDDPGVAVYFRRGDARHVIACDKYRHVRDNLHAVGKTIEAMRGIERWGASDLLDRAFQGFLALSDGNRQWWEVLGVLPDAPPSVVRQTYRELAKKAHPDTGGNSSWMAEVNAAFSQWEAIH